MSTCSICLNEVRSTRRNPPIRCGHVFHSCCIQEWKNKGKHTCPVCRKVFDASQFRVTVSIQNNYTAVSDAVELAEEYIFNALDMMFDVDTVPSLDSLLSDLGVSLADLDAGILDTE